MERQISLSKTELDTALEYSYDYINAIFQKQKRVMPFDLCFGDGSIHKPLNKEQVLALYNQMISECHE